jgi:flagellar hook-associated protein 1 FlgK
VALNRLAELSAVTVLERADGAVDVSIGQGRPLVIGSRTYDVTVSSDTNGLAVLSIEGTDITGEITSGRLGGLLHVRDVAIPAHAARLDQFAYDVATAVNAVHTAGFDGNGNPAGDFFVAPAAVAGAAAAFAVEPGIVADVSLVAGSSTGAVGDNQTARAISALRDATFANAGTATGTGAWGLFVYHVGADVASAAESAASRDEVVAALERLRDQASGVSVDEEAANLMRFQRAYEANARFFTTISDTLDTLMDMVR